MAGVSLKCGDCGTLLKSVEEAQEHAELTKHSNFVEPTEAVLNLVCSDCGKPCRSKTETDLHTKRTGHTEFVDKTSEAAKLISLEAPKPKDDVEMEEAGEGSGSQQEEMVVPEVNQQLLAELEEMGFPKERATRALHFSDNVSLEAAANWMVEHENDPDIDQMPLVPVSSNKPVAPKPSLTPEEIKQKQQELRELARKKKEEEEKRMEKEREKVSTSEGLKSHDGASPMFTIMYPAFVPGLFPPHQNQEHMNRGTGLYAVPVLPYMQPMAGFPSNTLIPFTYNLPMERSSETREAGGEQGQPGEQPQQQQAGGPQRQVVVRRFQIAIQLDLLLILKLAAVIFLFNQDGSRQRLTLLVFFASLIYLYQTGALAPVIRWLSQGMRRAAAPPQPPRPAVRADNLPAVGGQGNDNAGLAEGQAIGGENENEQVNDGNRGIVENENAAGEARQGEAGNRLWVIVKEIQMIVFGFITSLLPGFHNID